MVPVVRFAARGRYSWAAMAYRAIEVSIMGLSVIIVAPCRAVVIVVVSTVGYHPIRGKAWKRHGTLG